MRIWNSVNLDPIQTDPIDIYKGSNLPELVGINVGAPGNSRGFKQIKITRNLWWFATHWQNSRYSPTLTPKESWLVPSEENIANGLYFIVYLWLEDLEVSLVSGSEQTV